MSKQHAVAPISREEFDLMMDFQLAAVPLIFARYLDMAGAATWTSADWDRKTLEAASR
jgi:hypothetical protein